MVSYLDYKAQAFNFPAVFCAGSHDIDAGGIDRAVAQDIGELGDVFLNTVKCACKKLSIRRKERACSGFHCACRLGRHCKK